jgi:hypothetical protein
MKPTTTIFTAMLVVLAFAGCSKEDIGSGRFDPIKFYIAGTIEATGVDSTGYALLFQPNGAAVAVSAQKTANATYEFQNGHLKFIFENSSEGFDFVIENDRITNASELTHTMGLPYTYSLQKIPRTDDFKGKTFRGQVNNTGISVRFGNDGTLEVSQTINDLTVTQKGNYNLQNNAVAKASVRNLDSVLCIMLDGKLIISTSNATGGIQNYAVLDRVH